MPTYDPAAPWGGPYPQTVTDTDSGITWEAYGPNQLKKPSVVIQQAEDCCHYLEEVNTNLEDGVTPPAPTFAPPGKSDGDTLHVGHPNGDCFYDCVGGAWVLKFCRILPNLRDCFGDPLAASARLLTAAQALNSDAWPLPCAMEQRGQAIYKSDVNQRLYTLPQGQQVIRQAGGQVAEVTIDLTTWSQGDPYVAGPLFCFNLTNPDDCCPMSFDLIYELNTVMSARYAESRQVQAQFKLDIGDGNGLQTVINPLSSSFTNTTEFPNMGGSETNSITRKHRDPVILPPGGTQEVCIQACIRQGPLQQPTSATQFTAAARPVLYACGTSMC